MRKLVDTPNVDAPSGDFPKGRVRDKAGAVLGTEYREILHGDMIQFFQKLIIDAGITENDLPDNVTNGYQLLDALKATVYKRYTEKTLADGAMTTAEKDVITFTPDANQGFTDIKVTFSCRVTHQVGGSNEGLTLKLYVNGVEKEGYSFTIFTDGRQELVSFASAGFVYAPGDIVKITGQMTGNISTITSPRLIVEGINE